MRIERLKTDNITPFITDTIFTIVNRYQPNLFIGGFNTIIQDKIQMGGNKITTKILKNSSTRVLKVYHINSGYSILDFTNCKYFLIVKTDELKRLLLNIEFRKGDLSLRYGLSTEKIVAMSFSINNEVVGELSGVYFTATTLHHLFYNKKPLVYQKYQDQFDNISKIYSKYIKDNPISTKSNKEYLKTQIALKIIAMKFKNNTNINYNILGTLLRLISDDYKSKLSEEKFRRVLSVVTNPEIGSKYSRNDLINKFQMEVFINE